MKTPSATAFFGRKSLIGLTFVTVATTGCSALLTDIEVAAGREAGKALAAQNTSSNASSNTGTSAPPSNPPPSANTGGGASLGSSGVLASGSCLMKNADGTMLMCTEFENIPAEAGEMFQHNACIGGNSKWAESTKCPTEGRRGGCKSKADSKGAYAIVWQYMPNMARSARDGCVKDSANTWVE